MAVAGVGQMGIQARLGSKPHIGSSVSEMNDTDEDLVARCRGGDARAFTDLVGRYQVRLTRYARGIVGNEEDARDIAQEAFVRAYSHLDRFDSRRRFSVWMYGICSHVAVDWVRRRARREELGRRVPEGEGAPMPEAEAIREETAQQVQEAVTQLPLQDRQLVLLHYGEGLNCAEAAAVLGISHGAARVRLFRARQRLRETLAALVAVPDE